MNNLNVSEEGKDCSLVFLFPQNARLSTGSISMLPPLPADVSSDHSRFNSITAVDHTYDEVQKLSEVGMFTKSFSGHKTESVSTTTVKTDTSIVSCGSIVPDERKIYLRKIMRTLDAAARITYDDLEDIKMLPVDKYLLVNINVLGGKFKKITDELKARTCIPWLVEYLTIRLRRTHEEELRENNSFMLNIKHYPLHKSPKLNRLFDGIYTFKDSEGKVKFLTKYASAADFFALIVILLRRLPSVLCPIDSKLTLLLFSYTNQLPPTVEEYEQRLKKFQHAVLQCDVTRAGWYESIISISRVLFQCNERSRQEEISFSNLVHKRLRKCITNIYPLMRRNLFRYVLRNIMFETNRCVIRAFLHMRNGFPVDPKYQRVFDKTKSQIIADLAAVVGPNLLQLPSEYDNRFNRIKAMKGILWGISAPVLYRQQQKVNLITGTYTCHDNCLCGYGNSCTK